MIKIIEQVNDTNYDYRKMTKLSNALKNVNKKFKNVKSIEERNDSCILEPGMITTNEPGVYIEGSHGIRIENELLCVELCSNEYGKFLGFETITFAPIDIDCIDKKYLSEDELLFLNNYHQEVYEKLSVYLNDEEKEFLRKYTRKL